jgi:hypothetical protein
VRGTGVFCQERDISRMLRKPPLPWRFFFNDGIIRAEKCMYLMIGEGRLSLPVALRDRESD